MHRPQESFDPNDDTATAAAVLVATRPISYQTIGECISPAIANHALGRDHCSRDAKINCITWRQLMVLIRNINDNINDSDDYNNDADENNNDVDENNNDVGNIDYNNNDVNIINYNIVDYNNNNGAYNDREDSENSYRSFDDSEDNMEDLINTTCTTCNTQFNGHGQNS